MTRLSPIPWSAAAVAAAAVVAIGSCGGGDSGSPAQTVTIAVSPASVPVGETATLTWSATNASMCSASGAWAGPQSTSGSVGVSPAAPGPYTYTLGCSSSTSSAVSGAATLTVTPPLLSILTGAVSNGVIGTSYNQTIQAINGVSPFTWTVSTGALPNNLSLSASTTDTVTISGTPDTAAQAVTFTIEVTDSAHHTATQPYTVSILLQADSLALSPATLNFGNEVVGSTSGVLAETLTNTATSDMVINGITIATLGGGANGREFKQTSTTCGASLAAGASCTVGMSFTPGQAGPRAAAVRISDDTAGSPQSVGLGGVGLTAGPNATVSPVGLAFSTQLVGTTSPAQFVALTNYGSVTLNVGSIGASASFAETDNCVPSLASGATCTITVTFTPTGSGAVTGTLSISDDAPSSPQKVSLYGNDATVTPLLTGACTTCSGTHTESAQCPAGRPSETPGSISECGCPPGHCGGNMPVDLARACFVPHAPWHGYCETH